MKKIKQLKTAVWIAICAVLVCVSVLVTYLITSHSGSSSKSGTIIARISDADVQTQNPHLATLQGVFRGNLNNAGIESLLYDACRKADWEVVNKGPNFMAINYNHRGFDFDATIRFSNTKYSIAFKRLNQDRGDRAKAYEYYRKNSERLNATIQKLIYKSRY